MTLGLGPERLPVTARITPWEGPRLASWRPFLRLVALSRLRVSFDLRMNALRGA
jgi:hypothetical protein